MSDRMDTVLTFRDTPKSPLVELRSVESRTYQIWVNGKPRMCGLEDLERALKLVRRYAAGEDPGAPDPQVPPPPGQVQRRKR